MDAVNSKRRKVQIILEQYSNSARVLLQKQVEEAVRKKNDSGHMARFLSLFTAIELRDLTDDRIALWPKSTLPKELRSECTLQLQNPKWLARKTPNGWHVFKMFCKDVVRVPFLRQISSVILTIPFRFASSQGVLMYVYTNAMSALEWSSNCTSCT